MGRYVTRALTEEEFENMIDLIRSGYVKSNGRKAKPSPEIATILVVQANLGLRIGDILRIKLSNFLIQGDGYRLNIDEEKTDKSRKNFKVPKPIYDYIKEYAFENDITRTETLFKVSVRWIQMKIKEVSEMLGYEDVSTHSFRKYFATTIYEKNDRDITLIRELLQHSSVGITQNYISVSGKRIDKVLEEHIHLR